MEYIKIIIVAFVCQVSIYVSAQTVKSGAMPPIAPVSMMVYDTASVKVFYKYAFRKDSTVSKLTEGQTILLIGKNYCGFSDYYSWKMDSLNDAYYRKKRAPMELFGAGMALKGHVYDYPLVKGIRSGKATVQMENIGTYQYSQQLPQIQWQLEDQDSVINGIGCSKAVCNYGGRTWVAWYSKEEMIPWGPYLFDGLPGLAVQVGDLKHNFMFSLNGLVNLSVGEQIYLKKDDKIIITEKEKARKACRNECMNPVQALKISMPGIIIPQETEKSITAKPYNPIELP